MSARDVRRDLLWDFLVAHPDGVTVDDMMSSLDWDLRRCNDAIRDLRALLGDTDSVNLICDPQGMRERWLYRLIGTVDDARGWGANRIADGETRIRTLNAIYRSLVSATDGRTIEGRRARLTERALRRLIEDLDDLAEFG